MVGSLRPFISAFGSNRNGDYFAIFLFFCLLMMINISVAALAKFFTLAKRVIYFTGLRLLPSKPSKVGSSVQMQGWGTWWVVNG